MNNNNMELKILNFKKGVTTAGDTWNDSAYDTIETPSELTYEFDGCESHCSEIGATKEELIAKAIKTESWNTWFYEMWGEDKTFQEVGLESPMVFVPEEGEISVEGIGDFINNGKGLCPKTMYLEVKEQLLEIALKTVEITVLDENGEDITSQFSSQGNEIENSTPYTTIDFKIISKKNREVYQEGYVEIPENIEEPEEWFYYDQSGMVQPGVLTHHEGIGIKQIGATFEQEQEIAEFLQEVEYVYVEWVQDVILNSKEDEHETYEKGNLRIIINGDD